MSIVEGRLPTVPEYYSEYINSGVDLVTSPKQCCPFHQENTPSFSYDLETGRWSCFGKCHAHGDVIDMHQRWYKLSSRDEAKKSLYSMYRVSLKESLEDLANKTVVFSEERMENNAIYAEALALANTPDRWLELDYEMSKVPFERNSIVALVNRWKGVKSIFD